MSTTVIASKFNPDDFLKAVNQIPTEGSATSKPKKTARHELTEMYDKFKAFLLDSTDVHKHDLVLAHLYSNMTQFITLMLPKIMSVYDPADPNALQSAAEMIAARLEITDPKIKHKLMRFLLYFCARMTTLEQLTTK